VKLFEKGLTMNSGSFRKGEKRPKQGKHGSPKAVLAAREAISLFTDGNADRLQGWLDEIHRTDGAKAAFECYTRLLEYSLPKIQRTELTGQNGEAQVMTIRWLDSRD
jgi:hypothetical protein